MWSVIVSGILWLLNKLFGSSTGPSAEAVAAKSDGQATQAAATDAKAAQVASSEAQAAVDAPTDKQAVEDELNKGAF